MDRTDWVLSDVSECRMKIQWDNEPSIGFAPHGYVRLWQFTCDDADMISFPIERLPEVIMKLAGLKAEFDSLYAKVSE